MKDGNWVPIHKGFVKFLPYDRPYTEQEAMFSLSVDYDNNIPVSLAGYSTLWQWSRSKIRRFFDDYGIEIIYQENTSKKQKQKGQIKRQKKDRNETEKGQIRFVDSKCCEKQKNRNETEKGQKKDRSKDTTIDPIINPNSKPEKNNIENPLKNFDSFIANIPEWISEKWTKDQIIDKSETLVDYCNSSGKKYKDYYSALRNFLKKDYPNVIKQIDNGRSAAQKQIEETNRLLYGN